MNQLFLNIPYLSRLADMGFEIKPIEGIFLESIIDDVNQYAKNKGHFFSTQECQQFLVDTKSKFAFYWSLAQLNDSVDFVELGRLQSHFADATINLALHAAWYSDSLKQVVKFIPKQLQGQDIDVVPGLFVLGLGKLGGLDLNFSSDVDLVAYYDSKTLPIPNALGQGYIVNKVLQLMTKILRNDNKMDFVWRVDWRLRPDSSSSLLALSTDVGQQYYFFKALPWHRLALMKARVVAGDKRIGIAFLEHMKPFIWRQNLDYSALDELAHIKKRINLEHPALRYQRSAKDRITQECAGFNIKLGSGGIREIEFIVNALQLLWGGKQQQLRCTNTLQALEKLVEYRHLPIELAESLTDDYRYFRCLENAIQMLNNAQTHIIPTEKLSQRQLLLLLGREKEGQENREDSANKEELWLDLCLDIFPRRQRVNDFFEDFFSSSNTDNDDNEKELLNDDYQLPDNWEHNLNERSKAIFQNWTTGFTAYGLPSTMAIVLDPLANKLLKAIFESETDLNQSFVSIDAFLGSLSNVSQYFRLLVNNIELVESIVPPLLHSPHMGQLLKQSPHIIDHLLDPIFGDEESIAMLTNKNALIEQSGFVLSNDDYGIRLEALRRFVNESLYQRYLLFMRGDISVQIFQESLTQLAECTLSIALKIASDELSLDTLPMVVVGMGKLAMSRMSPLSDLDLVFIFADDFPLKQAQRVVSRLQTILAMALKEGIAYELDTRLRPSGKSGPPTVFISGFRQHHLERGKNWEHIALLSSRIVAGDVALGEQVMQVKRDIFSKQREPTQWLNDAKKMWRRIEQHRIKDIDPHIFGSKLRKGGLMQSEYLAVCYCIDALMEKNYFDRNQKYIADFAHLVNHLEGVGIPNIAFNKTIQFWSTVQIWERLLGLESKEYSYIPKEYLALMLEHLGCSSLDDFFSQAKRKSDEIEMAMQTYFSPCQLNDQELEDWQEMKVDWQ